MKRRPPNFLKQKFWGNAMQIYSFMDRFYSSYSSYIYYLFIELIFLVWKRKITFNFKGGGGVLR